VDVLKIRLAQYLGREVYFVLWQDRNKLHGNDLIQDTIMETLDQTDILLIILSPGYLNSKWYQLELDRFVEKMQSHKDITRVFVVEKNKADPPDCLKGLLNYRFWEQKDSKKAPTVFGEFKPDKAFYQVVNNIAYEMSQKLELIKQQTPVQPQVVDHRPQIYLAIPADDSYEPYEEVKRFLDSEGYRVVPETHIVYMNPTQYQEDVNKIMASCKAYVQVVGCSPGKLSPELPGICVLQHDCACKKDIPRLIWRDKINEEQIADQKLKEFVSLESAMINLEEFKQSILKQMRPAPQKEKMLIFLCYAQKYTNNPLIEKLFSFLRQNNFSVVQPNYTIQENTRSMRLELDKYLLSSDVVILFSQICDVWCESQIISIYKRISRRQLPIKCFALFTTTSPKQIRVQVPNLSIVNCIDDDGINEKEVLHFLEFLPIMSEKNIEKTDERTDDLISKETNFIPTHINYSVKIKITPEFIIMGGISKITTSLEPCDIIFDDPIFSVPIEDNDLCLFLDIPDGFEIIGPTALSIPLKHNDVHPDQTKTIHKARFKLRAISPSTSPITLELSTHSGTKKKISIPLEVTEIDQSSLFSDSISLKSRPVPHPDNILRIEPVYDATNSLISFHYLIRGSVTTNGESISFSSRSLPSGWLKNLKVLLTMAINAKNGSSEEKCKHLASLGQELSYQLCPNKLWSLLTKPYAKTLLILYPDNIWLPWEFMHDGDTFLCQRLIISRWPRKLNDQRPFEIPVERINLAHFSGVDQLENWKALLQLPENNAPEVKILPFDIFSDQPLLTEEKSNTLHGLHLIRQSVISMETDNYLPITKQEKTCDTIIKNEGNENNQKIDIGQSKHYMSSIRPLVSFSYLDSGEPTFTNLEKRWAASFVTSGASAFVGPIWPVKQDVDVSFLRGFYTYLWMGKSLGAAFQNGQQLAKTANPDTLDWMAYTLYGDPMARPYRPAKGEGYAVVQPIGRDINDSVQPGEKIRFSVSLQCSPPIWHDGRLVEISETLAYDNLQAHIGTFNLLIDPQHPVKMHKMGDDYRGWFTLQVPEHFAEDSSLVQIQLTDHDEPLHIVSFSLNIEKKQNDSREVFDA
jgi:hypothetical protein